MTQFVLAERGLLNADRIFAVAPKNGGYEAVYQDENNDFQSMGLSVEGYVELLAGPATVVPAAEGYFELVLLEDEGEGDPYVLYPVIAWRIQGPVAMPVTPLDLAHDRTTIVVDPDEKVVVNGSEVFDSISDFLDSLEEDDETPPAP